ncbi:MAG: hypothetical protein R2822_06350 [Spirosomataceae bacterium]
MIWTAIPAVIMAVLVFLGYRSWSEIMSDAPADSQVVEIMDDIVWMDNCQL